MAIVKHADGSVTIGIIPEKKAKPETASLPKGDAVKVEKTEPKKAKASKKK